MLLVQDQLLDKDQDMNQWNKDLHIRSNKLVLKTTFICMTAKDSLFERNIFQCDPTLFYRMQWHDYAHIKNKKNEVFIFTIESKHQKLCDFMMTFLKNTVGNGQTAVKEKFLLLPKGQYFQATAKKK